MKSIHNVDNMHCRYPFVFPIVHCLDQCAAFLTLLVELPVRKSLCLAIETLSVSGRKLTIADFHAGIVAELGRAQKELQGGA